jgi:two-component system, sensor histidine kinase and response regulator
MPDPKTTLPPAILLADDDEAHRLLIKIELEDEGYDVFDVADGKAAVDLYPQAKPDIVLLDNNMPELTGIEACRAIRTMPDGARLPILLLTVMDDQETIDRAFDAGITDYITKPVNKHILKQRLRKLMQARKNDKLRDDLVKMLVHDMKTPITAIKLGSELMMDEGDPDPEMLELIRDNSLRLLNLVMGILDASRLQNGKLSLSRTTRNVRAILEAVRESFGWMKVTRDIALEIERCEPDLEAWLDWVLIERVLINLITNAFKHSPNHSRIFLSAVAVDGELRLSVRDMGEGIPPADHERIFEEFTKAAQGNASSFLDTGLGLTFCRLAVEAHGGRITLDSDIGKGALFTLRLPIQSAPFPQL